MGRSAGSSEDTRIRLTEAQYSRLLSLLNEPPPEVISRPKKGASKWQLIKYALKRLVFLPNGEFSITRIIMILTFAFAISLGLTGLFVYLFTGTADPQTGTVIGRVVLPDNLYSYTFKIAGGGFVQYGLTKAHSIVGNYISSRYEYESCSPEDTPDGSIGGTVDNRDYTEDGA